VKAGLFLPIFDELSDPVLVARLAAEAEEAGWDGVFVWDHISYRDPVRAVADPWVTLSAVATSTSGVRLGPMITPLPRRRPVVVARQIASLDQLSAGRFVFGVGIGSDGAGELSATGEELDDRTRGAMLDEGLAILRAAWTGDRVDHQGEHYTVNGLTLLPTPVQPAGPPVWVAARYGNRKPLRRAAQHDGVFPIDLENADQLIEVIDDVREMQTDKHTPYDVVVGLLPGVDPAPYVAAGATWCLASFSPYGLRVDTVRGVLRDGPYSSG
jgi:alkanesulfonate monooxygenase SsuD/methylene tetrahydromethanopterin reductase-like flavin-dependent oxidoreductase (luciferase family)